MNGKLLRGNSRNLKNSSLHHKRHYNSIAYIMKGILRFLNEKMRKEKQKRKGKIYPSECKLLARRDKKAFLNEQCK